MSYLPLVANPRASEVKVTADELIVYLADGRTLSVPLTWFPRLLEAPEEKRQGWVLLGDGEGIHWPDIDEDVSIPGLLRGEAAPSALVGLLR